MLSGIVEHAARCPGGGSATTWQQKDIVDMHSGKEHHVMGSNNVSAPHKNDVVSAPCCSDIQKSHQEDAYEHCNGIAKYLRIRLKPCHHSPEIGIICGSGLGGLANLLEDPQTFPYEDIPAFPVSTVPGHAGALIFGRLDGKSVVCMKGRFHTYEGYPSWKCAMPVRVMKLLGAQTLIVTNAAGGLNPNFKVGDIMIIKDHINWPMFSGHSSLVGPNDERFGPRFPPMSEAYDKRLRQLAREVGERLGYSSFLREGVYSMQSGPCFETIAECRLIQLVGGDCTGMSTVPEVCVARHCGMRVLGFSLITNECVMCYDEKRVANHAEVLETGQRRSVDMQTLVAEVVKLMEPPPPSMSPSPSATKIANNA